MRLEHGVHLTYCTNIHPGEDLPSVRQALTEHVLEVKALMSPHKPFGVGLRLSNLASEQLAEGNELRELREFLDDNGLYVFTINGFPYGAFHGERVKERVYEPDWRSVERLQYSNRLADQLAALLPDDVEGSVSTLPCAFSASVKSEGDVERMVEHLLQHVAHLHALCQRTGRTVALALEPEPSCFLETIDETVRFFEQHFTSTSGIARLARLTRLSPSDARIVLRRHLGLCLDTCHAAVEFEDPIEIFVALERAGIDVKKLQLSAGLQLPQVDEASLRAVSAFAEDVYLHQTVADEHGALVRYLDLPNALATTQDGIEPGVEWRVHFHVPIFLDTFGALRSTQAFLLAVLERQRAKSISQHLEVETYTWDVLPALLRGTDVDGAIGRELGFVLNALGERQR